MEPRVGRSPVLVSRADLGSVSVSPVLVEPDGLTAPETKSGRSTGTRHWVSAAIVGVLAVATLAIGQGGGVDLMNLSERRLIEAHLESWYGGDFDAANALRAPQRLRTGPSEERSRAEVEYQAMLGATTELLGCVSLPPSTIRCDVAYGNVLNEAVGKVPAVVSQQFGIEDGRILFVAGPYLEDERMTASYARFANLLFRETTRPRVSRSPTSRDRLAPSSSWPTSRIGHPGTELKKAEPNYPSLPECPDASSSPNPASMVMIAERK
jgi:hypothetical protein